MSRKVVLFIAMSLDGFIASPEGSLDFLSVVEKEGEDYGYAAFTDSVDTVILGRKTYDKIVSMEVGSYHPDKRVYVLTRTPKEGTLNVQFYTEGVKTLLDTLLQQKGANIYCDGGAETVRLLLDENLMDEMIISVIPVLLGEGISLFSKGGGHHHLQLIESRSFERGLVQLRYRVEKRGINSVLPTAE